MSHLAPEVFAIAHHNAYYHLASKPEYQHYNKDIGALLAPHFTNLIALNTMARVTLIAPINNQLTQFQGMRGEDFGTVIALWYTKREDLWNNDIGFYEELKTRGFNFDSFKHVDSYRYMKDGKKIYDTLHDYVSKVVRS